MKMLEPIATACGLTNVYLAARANIWNFFFGVITVTLYMIIFYKVKLYADMSLQIVFLILQFVGFYDWKYGGARHSELKIKNAPLRTYIMGLVSVTCLFLSIAYILKNYTSSNTVYIDSFTTSLSLVAQWMMNRKWLQHWFLWMTVDIISIKMYIFKHLYFTSGLYAVFFVICCMGYANWRRQCYD